MTLSLYQTSIPLFMVYMKNLSAILEKGRLHAAGKEKEMIEARLIGDMGDLAFQIQRTSNAAKSVATLVGRAAPEEMENNEKTFPELQTRLSKTIEYLAKLEPTAMDGMEDQDIMYGQFKLNATDYVLKYAIPNFYFHVSIAYAILRKEGVDIGKGDYVGYSG
jgi:hypothetical protein